MSYLQNIEKANHTLTEAQRDFLQPYLQEVDVEMFDMVGRSTVEPHEFIAGCFKKAVIATTDHPDFGVSTFAAFKYFRSIVSSFDEYKVKEDYNIMMATFSFAGDMFIKQFKK